MKYLALVFLLIVCASAANTNRPSANKRNKNNDGISSRYDVPPDADLPPGIYRLFSWFETCLVFFDYFDDQNLIRRLAAVKRNLKKQSLVSVCKFHRQLVDNQSFDRLKDD